MLGDDRAMVAAAWGSDGHLAFLGSSPDPFDEAVAGF
jgi:hypothetical protein